MGLRRLLRVSFMVHDSWFMIHGSRFMIKGSWLLLVHGSGQLMVHDSWLKINELLDGRLQSFIECEGKSCCLIRN